MNENRDHPEFKHREIFEKNQAFREFVRLPEGIGSYEGLRVDLHYDHCHGEEHKNLSFEELMDLTRPHPEELEPRLLIDGEGKEHLFSSELNTHDKIHDFLKAKGFAKRSKPLPPQGLGIHNNEYHTFHFFLEDVGLSMKALAHPGEYAGFEKEFGATYRDPDGNWVAPPKEEL